jgi:hypothetical protein
MLSLEFTNGLAMCHSNGNPHNRCFQYVKLISLLAHWKSAWSTKQLIQWLILFIRNHVSQPSDNLKATYQHCFAVYYIYIYIYIYISNVPICFTERELYKSVRLSVTQNSRLCSQTHHSKEDMWFFKQRLRRLQHPECEAVLSDS